MGPIASRGNSDALEEVQVEVDPIHHHAVQKMIRHLMAFPHALQSIPRANPLLIDTFSNESYAVLFAFGDISGKPPVSNRRTLVLQEQVGIVIRIFTPSMIPGSDVHPPPALARSNTTRPGKEISS